MKSPAAQDFTVPVDAWFALTPSFRKPQPLCDDFFLANSCRRRQPHTWLSYTLRKPEPDSVLPQEPLLAEKSSPHWWPDRQKVRGFTGDVNELLEKHTRQAE